MKKSNLLLVLLFGVTACSEKKGPTLISRWVKQNEVKSTERTLASTMQGACFKNNFTVEILKDQIKDLEVKFEKAPKVKGMWKHIDLSKIPVPQANFLKRFGNMIGDQKNKDAIDYSACTDVPCLFNKIYGKEDHQAGYLHYLWYLKFGHMLSADNKMPEDIDGWGKKQNIQRAGFYNGVDVPLEKYLYNDDELYGLWRLSMMLNEPYKSLTYLEEIQRIPRGNAIEGHDPMVCGLAYSGGWIKVNDGCLDPGWDKESGFLYYGLTHEMNHQIDYQLGRGTREYYRSHKPDYLAAAGFTMKEWVEGGVTKRQWDHLPGSKFVRDYAATSPEEAYADTIAYFRVSGDETKQKTTAEHYNYISKNIFSNKTFEKTKLLDLWLEKRSSEINETALKAVLDCSKSPGGVKSLFLTAADFKLNVFPSMLNCISKKSEDISKLLATEISQQEPEGCSVMNSRSLGNAWVSVVKKGLVGIFEKHLTELNNDKEYVAKIDNYYKSISDKTLSYDAYVNCYRESNEEECFETEVRSNLSKKAEELSLPQEQVDEFVTLYFTQHSHAKVKERVTNEYKTYLATHQQIMVSAAEKSFNECREISHNDDDTPTGSLFTVQGYLVSSFYNCLNIQVADKVKDVIKQLASIDFVIANGKEEILLADFITPEIVKVLEIKYQEEKVKEVEKAKEFLLADEGALRKSILADLSWVSNAGNTESVNTDCSVAAKARMTFLPLYHSKDELFAEHIEKQICYQISESKEFNDWLETTKAPYIEQMLNTVGDVLYEEATAEAKVCLEQYPMDNIFNKIRYQSQRETCLANSWDAIEERTSTKILSDPMTKKLTVDKTSLRAEMLKHREYVHTKVKKEQFKIDIKLELPFKEFF